ncbi:gp017 [Rhodococcus phage ReqiDocB7]|uniref:gp017 n=1 Tax=Rhodococcus phage ReqiDocB7 TaxID=691966 RepID=UPI0001CDD753|nr:gp017 [Rhodococcus phage ReqiDocB7]ADD80803.1 gp017 [Rhodococcus phage ReqiDocB7]
MAIEGNEVMFPNNVVNVTAARIEDTFDLDGYVVRRPLTTLDPDESIGVVAATWVPTGKPEMGQRENPFENFSQGYSVMIQALIVDGDEERAIARHSILSTRVRRMLYRDPVLLGTFLDRDAGLKVIADGVTETISKLEVRSQRFLVHKEEGSSRYLSILEFYFETQIQL